MTPSRILAIAIGAVVLIVGLALSGQLVENLDAEQIMVVQSPVVGTLTWHTTPGIKWQGVGKVTKYQKRSIFWFSNKPNQGAATDQSIKIRFNDGGHANVSGSIQWDMPLDAEHLVQLHTKYGSQHAIDQQLIRTVVERSVYMTGPLMSSKESYAERRNELLQFIEDQVQGGIYKTTTAQVKQPDPMTGEMKTVTVVTLVQDAKHGVLRTAPSPIEEFGIRTFAPAIDEIKYDPTVEEQITQQQKLTMQVQTAMAKAREAEQNKITTEKNGEAAAMAAKWEQEVIKAKEVTAAEQRLRVAEIDRDAAEQTKQKDILLGEGEATRKKLVMQADGALEPKLATYLKAVELWSGAVKEHPGPWVPTIVMGGGAGGVAPGGAATPLIDLLTAKTAMDLGLDLAISGRNRTRSAGGNNADESPKGTGLSDTERARLGMPRKD